MIPPGRPGEPRNRRNHRKPRCPRSYPAITACRDHPVNIQHDFAGFLPRGFGKVIYDGDWELGEGPVMAGKSTGMAVVVITAFLTPAGSPRGDHAPVVITEWPCHRPAGRRRARCRGRTEWLAGVLARGADPRRGRPQKAAAEALVLIGDAPYALHFDSDCIDFADLPICENTDRNVGLSHQTAFQALTYAAGPGLHAITITQITPNHGAADGSTINTFTHGLVTALISAAAE